MTRASLTKAFATVALASSMTGCATTCDKQCNLELSARTMTGSGDIGIRAMGLGVLENLHPELKKEGDVLRAGFLPKKVECTVGGIEMVNGRKMVHLTGCSDLNLAPAGP